jgi:DNA-binding NarL/FixJ family response regulator
MMDQVVVADGAAIFRTAVRSVLEREKDFAVSEAASLEELVAQLELRRVDMALIDQKLPPRGALPAVAAALGRCREIVVWGTVPEPAIVLDAIRAGATGFLRKDISPENLVRALRGTSRGEAPLSRELTAGLIDELHRFEERDRARRRTAQLSEREREVLAHVARGRRNKQIAAALTISEFTVKRHVQNILDKLELESRREAAAVYTAAGEVLA